MNYRRSLCSQGLFGRIFANSFNATCWSLRRILIYWPCCWLVTNSMCNLLTGTALANDNVLHNVHNITNIMSNEEFLIFVTTEYSLTW